MERPVRPVNVSRRPRIVLTLAAALATAGCSWMPTMPNVPGASLFESPRQVRGHQVHEDDLAQLTVGVSSRNDVAALLGSPSATGTFDDHIWYYMSSVTRQRPGRTLSVEDHRVVAIVFNAGGTVQEIRQTDQDDMREVRVVARVTPSPGNERTFLQQLFGNLGRLGPGVGGQSAPTVGAPTPSSR
jgi:outer membrane protein assembly factor BamE (lipoprotein component of BamABCDE complex)